MSFVAISARKRPGLKDERRPSFAMCGLVAEATRCKLGMKTRRGVVQGRTPKAWTIGQRAPSSDKRQCDTEDVVSAMRGGARRWGEDSFLSPNMRVARATAPQGGLARNSDTPRQLGARSPSGNSPRRMPRMPHL